MNIIHHRKGNVGQARRHDGISDNNNDDDDGYNKVEDRNDELEMGNGGKGNNDSENRQGGTNNNGKAIGNHTLERANNTKTTRLLVGLTLAVMFFHSLNKPCNFIPPKPDAQEKETDAPQDRPFPMPIQGEKFEIFQPPLRYGREQKESPALALPKGIPRHF